MIYKCCKQLLLMSKLQLQMSRAHGHNDAFFSFNFKIKLCILYAFALLVADHLHIQWSPYQGPIKLTSVKLSFQLHHFTITKTSKFTQAVTKHCTRRLK